MKTCSISGKSIPADEAVHCTALRPSLLHFIQQRHPQVSKDDWISQEALPELKSAYVEAALADEMGEISSLEREVIESLRQQEILSAKPDDEGALARRSFGERLADKIASFGGSWRFIIWFGSFIAIWILCNALMRSLAPDPYPYILLNLMLSCLAALQAPVIMMSQNRQEVRDRRQAKKDYQINLKAELEIRHLHEKIDHLLHHHSERLLEIQNIQTEMLRQLVDARK